MTLVRPHPVLLVLLALTVAGIGAYRAGELAARLYQSGPTMAIWMAVLIIVTAYVPARLAWRRVRVPVWAPPKRWDFLLVQVVFAAFVAAPWFYVTYLSLRQGLWLWAAIGFVVASVSAVRLNPIADQARG